MGDERTAAWVAIFFAVWASVSTAGAAPVEDFFKGKTLNIVLPTAPGGDRAANAMPFLDRIGKHIPGEPRVLPVYMPGAGGAVGMNYLYNVAPHDGTFIGSPLAGFIVSQVTKDASVQYDVSKMNWIGRTTDTTEVLYVWGTSKIKTWEDAKQRSVTIGSSGINSASTIIPRIVNAVFGTRFKVIQGYDGAAAFNLAVQRGETDGSLTTWGDLRNSHANWVRDHLVRVLFQVSSKQNPELPTVPVISNMGSNAADSELLGLMTSSADLGDSFVAPPNVPASVVGILRKAFDDTMKDPVYIATTKRLGIELNPLPGKDLADFADKTLATPSSIVARYVKAVSTP